jgi:hypothetical protein
MGAPDGPVLGLGPAVWLVGVQLIDPTASDATMKNPMLLLIPLSTLTIHLRSAVAC